MRYGTVLTTALFLTLSACSKAPTTEARTATRALDPAAKAPAKAAKPAPAEHKVGDFWVHRISGSFSEKPMVLVERVVAVDETSTTVEYTVEDQDGQSQMLVTREASTDQIISVMRLVDGQTVPASIADFEGLIARTTFAPDSNEGYKDRTLGTCLVGPSELDCETKTYRVMVGEREATLDITRSDKYPGRDIGGEITSADGEVIYRAELLETGNNTEAKPSVAAR
ncbi:MAG TPA: hypothetical protein VM686_40500 [Polyangiaceae bacterium]|nr:hypothetical protein [Polyangiaceae bacterium]